jgi:drug/metabolite transporter (DMT)-like permease
MSNLKLTTHGGLIEATIIAKQETYYLLTEDNISSIKSKSLLGDLFVLLASLAWGAYFSVITTISSIHEKENSILLPLFTLKNVFLSAGVLFSILTILMFYFSYTFLADLKKSGKLEIDRNFDKELD